jgi:hypothetical protein
MNTQFDIPFSEFNLKESQFDHPSRLHGVMHTYRVMVHVIRLGVLTGRIAEAKNAFFAAYIHDMARKHDGYCTQHGTDAANFKLPLYKSLFQQNGASLNDLLIIGKATAMHSLGNELAADDTDWYTVALLKDADALDRIRLGEDDLNTSYLRLSETHTFIDFAKQLYYKSVSQPATDFNAMMEIVKSLQK